MRQSCAALCGNLRNYALRTGTHKKFTDFHSGMSPKIRGFAICGLQKKFACPPLIITKQFCSKNRDQLYRIKNKITEQ